MRRLIFVGSHLGYPMDRTPLGGGAMVGLQLVRHWPDARPLLAIGSGPAAPRPGVEYVRLPEDAPRQIVNLGELAYAAFCRGFERSVTDWILARRDRFVPEETSVLVNDISEGPDLERLSEAGYRIVSIWHVDVVDYFNKLYLRRILEPERLTALYERASHAGLEGAVPDVLRLVFGKQKRTVEKSAVMIVPSAAMADTIGRCYGKDAQRRCEVVPWGVWTEPVSEPAALEEADRLRDHYQLRPGTRVLLTLSRISPEKGIHLLLRALRRLEADGSLDDACLFVCGEPAFMQGERYARLVRREAGLLRRVRVFFPGYLDAQAKRAYFKLAQLFVSPSVHESFGLNVVEAMNAGLPVLASDHYGVRDVLPDDCGRRVPYPSLPEAPAALAAALKGLLADPEALAAMGRRARARAEAMPFQKAADRVLELALGVPVEAA